MYSQVKVALAFPGNCSFPEEFPNTLSFSPIPNPCPWLLCSPQGSLPVFVSFQRREGAGIASIPSLALRWFCGMFCARAPGANPQCRGLCWNEAPSRQLVPTGGILVLSSTPGAWWLCWNGASCCSSPEPRADSRGCGNAAPQSRKSQSRVTEQHFWRGVVGQDMLWHQKNA